MSGSRNEEDVIGPWSEDKLDLLGKYLAAYTTIMHGQSWCRNGYHYIDAFAGSSRPRAKDEQRYIDGSPRIALTIKYPFTSYTFIEIEPWRVERLNSLVDEFPDRDIRIKQGDCNEIIVTYVVPRIQYKRYNRGFIFLDPFAMSVEWTTIEQIAQTRALEIFLNFPVMAINRTSLPNNPEKLTRAQIDRNNRLWGTTDWYEDIYEVRETLFGPREFKKRPTTAKRLSELFRSRLLQVFPYASYPVVMTNSTGQPIYCLICAGHNDKGVKIINSIFKKYERLSD